MIHQTTLIVLLLLVVQCQFSLGRRNHEMKRRKPANSERFAINNQGERQTWPHGYYPRMTYLPSMPVNFGPIQNIVSQPVQCPFPYKQIGYLCLYGTCSASAVSWDKARTFCNDLSGDLAVIKKDCDHDEVAKYISSLDGSQMCKYWIGANHNSRGWTWLDGTPIAKKSSIWAENYPKTNSANVYAYIEMGKTLKIKNTITNSGYSPLCQFNPPQQTAYEYNINSFSPNHEKRQQNHNFITHKRTESVSADAQIAQSDEKRKAEIKSPEVQIKHVSEGERTKLNNEGSPETVNEKDMEQLLNLYSVLKNVLISYETNPTERIDQLLMEHLTKIIEEPESKMPDVELSARHSFKDFEDRNIEISSGQKETGAKEKIDDLLPFVVEEMFKRIQSLREM